MKDKKVNVYQVKIPEKVANNFLSIFIESNGMISVYWDDSELGENSEE